MKKLGNGPFFFIVVLIIYKIVSTIGFRLRELPDFIKANSLLFLVLVTVGQHSLFASFGWLYRYEAYLYLLVCFVIVKENYHFSAAVQKQLVPRTASILVLIPVFLFGAFHFIARYIESEKKIRFAGKNIYEQQIQTSRFLHKYYEGATVIANDIGAITYFAGIRLVDPYGLGSLKVLQLMRASPGKKVPFIDMVNAYPGHPPTIYVIYESWYKQQLKQADLIKAGEMQIVNNVICAFDRVSFLAPTKEEAEKLAEHLEEFKATTPRDVIVTIN